MKQLILFFLIVIFLSACAIHQKTEKMNEYTDYSLSSLQQEVIKKNIVDSSLIETNQLIITEIFFDSLQKGVLLSIKDNNIQIQGSAINHIKQTQILNNKKQENKREEKQQLKKQDNKTKLYNDKTQNLKTQTHVSSYWKYIIAFCFLIGFSIYLIYKKL